MSNKFRPLKTIEVTCKECGHVGKLECTDLQVNTAAVNFVARFNTKIENLENKLAVAREALERIHAGSYEDPGPSSCARNALAKLNDEAL